MLRRFFLLVLLTLLAAPVGAATIYIDTALVSDCTSGNYSIANHNCSGSDGNGYNDILAAYNFSGTNDTIYLRSTGSTHTINTSDPSGIMIKQGQTWGTRPGDLPTKATITVGASNNRIFQTDNITNATIQNLKITSAKTECIYIDYSTDIIIEDNEITDCNTNIASEIDAVSLTDCCGDGSPIVHGSGYIVRRNWIHDINIESVGKDNACIKMYGFNTNFTIEDNLCHNAGNGIWADGASSGHIWRRNIVHNITEHCYHLEVGSSATITNNIGYECGWQAVHIRPGDSGLPNTKIQNNTFWNFGDQPQGGGSGGIMVQQDGTAHATDLLIENNILASSIGSGHLLTVAGANATEATNFFRNNLFYAESNNNGICWDNTTGSGHACSGESYADTGAGISSWEGQCSGATCSGNVSGSPVFVNAASADFHLQTSSPAKNTGLTIGAITTDFCNGASAPQGFCAVVSRPQGAAYDIGAFEFVESESQPGPPKPFIVF